MAIEGVPKTMLACQIVEFGKPYKIHDIPTPEKLREYELLVKVAVSSLCHTDFMVLDGVFGSKLPQIASHEVATPYFEIQGTGTVVAVGSSVKDIKKGDRVMCGLPTNHCGKCRSCQMPPEFHQYCPNMDGHLGVTRDGAFAEYLTCDSRSSAVLPDKVSFETAAPMACAGSTVYRAIVRAGLKKGEWLGLVGSGGGLGHVGIQFAKAAGLKVIGIDARDEGLELSKEVGADAVIDARKGKDKVVEEVQKLTGGEGVDATINVSDAESAAALACAITKMHAKMIQVAQPDEVSIPFPELIFRDVRIEGSIIISKAMAEEMLQVVAEHNITVETNSMLGLKEIPKLVELAHSGKMKGKGVIIVDQKQIDDEIKLQSKRV